MRKRLIFGSTLILMTGIFSCQKSGNLNNGSSTGTNLYTAAAEIVGTQISKSLTSDEHSVAVEKFDGTSPAYLEGADGSHMNFGLHGWDMHMGPLKFGVPHIDSCVTVTVSGNAYPREIVIEYLEGCLKHHRDRHGKVIIHLSDTITNEGALQTITYQDFYIDTVKVELNASLENLGKNTSGNWVIEKKYTQTITKNEETVVRTNHEMVEWVNGFETTDRSDNIYYVSGSGSVIANDTARYTKSITAPLLFDASCEYIKSGVVELTRHGNVSVIDYGDGTCDDVATITTNGSTEEITLHGNMFRKGGEFEHHCHGFGHGLHH